MKKKLFIHIGLILFLLKTTVLHAQFEVGDYFYNQMMQQSMNVMEQAMKQASEVKVFATNYYYSESSGLTLLMAFHCNTPTDITVKLLRESSIVPKCVFKISQVTSDAISIDKQGDITWEIQKGGKILVEENGKLHKEVLIPKEEDRYNQLIAQAKLNNSSLTVPIHQANGSTPQIQQVPSSKICPTCKGTGVSPYHSSAAGYGVTETKRCNICGEIVPTNYYHANCNRCNGRGIMP